MAGCTLRGQVIDTANGPFAPRKASPWPVEFRIYFIRAFPTRGRARDLLV